MAIIQISKIQQRSGNLVDLPQLDEAEFGWATDERRLFIGKADPAEDVEVLTSYSHISFSQIDGSDGGNLNIVNATDGQILTFVAATNTWENWPSASIVLDNPSFKVNLGNVENININGGAIGYLLETDGLGNLSWTPKGALYTHILDLFATNPIVMTVATTTPYTNDTLVTITGVDGTSNNIVNGQSFYIQLAPDYPTSGNVELYTGPGAVGPVDGTGLTYTNPPDGIATSVFATGGGGGGTVGGANTTVQFNDNNISNGVATFTFNKNTTTLTVSSGNVVTGNVSATGSITAPVLISNVATGTAPFTVTSTTRVANLYVDRANVSDTNIVTQQTTGTYYPTFVNAVSGNLAPGANANLSFNAATGNLKATLFTGTLTTGAQPNITSVGILTSLSSSGNINAANFMGALANTTSNVSIPVAAGNINLVSNGNTTLVVAPTSANVNGNLSVSGNITGSNIAAGNVSVSGNIIGTNINGSLSNGTSSVSIPAVNGNIAMSVGGTANVVVISTTAANITGQMISTTANVTGNANVGNLGTSGTVIASTVQSNVATGTPPLVVSSTTRVSNLNVSYSNVSDNVAMNALITGVVYPTFVSGTATANYSLGSNTAIYANIANSSMVASQFVGNITGTTGNFSAGITVYATVNSNAIKLVGRASDNASAISFYKNDTVSLVGNVYNTATAVGIGAGSTKLEVSTSNVAVTGNAVVTGNVSITGNTSIVGQTLSTYSSSYQAIFSGWGPLEANALSGAIVIGGASSGAGRGEIHYWNNNSPNPALYIDNTRDSADARMIFRLRTSGSAVVPLTLDASGGASFGGPYVVVYGTLTANSTTQPLGTSNTSLATTAFVQNAFTNAGFKKMVQVPQQGITPDATLYFAHGLGAVPVLIQPIFVCVSPDLGYSPGDEVIEYMISNDYTGGGATIYWNSTYVVVLITNNGTTFTLMPKSGTHSRAFINNSCWNIKFNVFGG